MSGEGKLPDRARTAELLREALDVSLPADLAAQVIEGRRTEPRTELSWLAAVTATVVVLAISLWIIPAGEAERPGAHTVPIVVTLGPAASSDGSSQVSYTVHADGKVADKGRLDLTRYALETVSEQSLLDEAF